MKLALCLPIIFMMIAPAYPQEAEGVAQNTQLQMDILEIPNGFFLGPDKRTKDFSDHLRSAGLEMPEGSLAAFKRESRMLFLRSSRKDINLLKLLIEEKAPIDKSGGWPSVRITARSYLYSAEDVREIAGLSPSLEWLRELPDDRLRLLQATSVATSPGHESRIAGKREEGIRVDFECMPVIGIRDEVIHLAYNYKLEGVVEGMDTSVHVNSSAEMDEGGGVVLEAGVVPGEKPRLILLAIEVKHEEGKSANTREDEEGR